jgi:beta-glucosidase
MTGRTYRYATEEPLFPFGFGLSYTRFTYGDIKLDKATVPAGESLFLSCVVTNNGAVEGEEVAQIYLSDMEASTVVPLHSLVGFRRVHLKPGERAIIDFSITPETMKMVNDAGDRVLEPGKFRVTVGGCSPGERGITLGAPAPISEVFTVTT